MTGDQAGQAGLYTVIVSNVLGTATNSFNLNVVPLFIPYQPQNEFVLMGTTLRLSAPTFGQSPIYRQWLFNGVDLPGATNDWLTISNVQPHHWGLYALRASSALSSILSDTVTVSVSQVLQWYTSNYAVGNVPHGLTNIVALSSFNGHTLALISNGTVVAWGRSISGQTNVPLGLSNVVSVAAGGTFSLALKSDGTVVAWGSQTNAPAHATNLVAITAGYGHSLGVTAGGTVVAWGQNTSGQTNVPSGLSNVVAVAAGDRHSLALRRDGSLVAWGINDAGQTAIPPAVSNIVSIAAGHLHNLALTESGTVHGWGSYSFGQSQVPAGLSNVVAIAAGWGYSLALRADGSIAAWGTVPDTPPNLPLVNLIEGGENYGIVTVGNQPPVTSAEWIWPRKSADGFRVTLPTQAGRVYGLEFKLSLNDPVWIPLPLIAGNGTTMTLLDPAPSGSQRFYRVRRW